MKTQPIKVDGNDKLHWLRRLDHVRPWEFLDDQRCCLSCGKTFSGRQVRLVGGTRPFGPLGLRCPTRRCPATPANWVYLHEVPGQVTRSPRFDRVRLMRSKSKGVRSLGFPPSLVPLPRYAVFRAGFRFLSHVGVVT